MEQKIIKTDIGQSLEIETDYYYSAKAFSIIELRKFLRKATDNGATHITISGSCYDGRLDNIDIQPVNIKTEKV